MAKMRPIILFVLHCLIIVPVSGAIHHIRQLVQVAEQVAGISTIDTRWASFASDGEASQTLSLDEDCVLEAEVAEILELAGLTERSCSSAVRFTGLLHGACVDNPQCQHPFISIEEQQGGLRTVVLGNEASHACLLASLLLGQEGSVLGATDDAYRSHIQVNWSKDCWYHARCVVKPSSAAQVQQVMKTMRVASSKFAIRSGGHNPNCGWSSIGSEGVLIDLSGLGHVQPSSDALSIKLGPGRRWIDVYKALDGTGRTVLGGRTPDVGVGGLLLGGGIPSFSSEFGFACDLVSSYEVVLANGSIVRAQKDLNEDLWWALKGGGSNFGIVTEFELRTVPIDQIWYESRIYAASESASLIKATREYQIAAENDQKASFAFSLSNNHTIVAFIYSAPVENPEVFSMFYDIPFVKHFIPPTFGTPYSLAAAFERVLGDRPSFKRDIIAVSTKPDLDLYEKAYANWLNVSREMMSRFDCMMTFGIQPVTSNAVIKSQSCGETPMNVNLRPVSQHWYTSVIQWQDDAFDDLAHMAVVRSGGAVEEFAKQKGISLEFKFFNDASWHQDPLGSYGGATVERLLRISQKYDPQQVFQTLQGAGFLLANTHPAKKGL